MTYNNSAPMTSGQAAEMRGMLDSYFARLR